MVDTQIAILTAVDFDGNRRNLGGDPVTIKLIGPLEETQEGTSTNVDNEQQRNNSNDGTRISDHKNGQYTIHLCLSVCGRYLNCNL